MSSDRLQIKINSILGGHSPTTHFAREDQFRVSMGIDPALPIDGGNSQYGMIASGLLRPSSSSKISGTTLNNAPRWIVDNPKSYGTSQQIAYVYDSVGSVYAINEALTFTGLKDLNDTASDEPKGSIGNGAAYYDNYIYFARSTTVARYGPLNGSPGWTTDYWGTTLSKTALTNNVYPSEYLGSGYIPNHVLHRHSDGRLYIADVVDGTGTIHFIQTKKTTVEGDTDDGSTYDKLNVGYNLIPVAMDSYGSDLVIAFNEWPSNAVGNDDIFSRSRAKIAFWDTTSTDVNQITWVEFPDSYISALKNINGILYVFSGIANSEVAGFRITRFVGGYTFEEVLFSEYGSAPLAGAVDGDANRLLFGSSVETPSVGGVVFSYGLQSSKLGQGLFSVMRATGNGASSASGGSVNITALKLLKPQSGKLSFNTPIIGWTTGSAGGEYNGIDVSKDNIFNEAQQFWWSQLYRIGQPFKITKIRIPLAQVLDANMTVTPKIYIDSGSGSKTLTAITSANYGTNRQTIVIRPENLTADNDFWLELRWTGSALCTVALPITIEYELLDTDSAYQ